jgi:hypothetical protein
MCSRSKKALFSDSVVSNVTNIDGLVFVQSTDDLKYPIKETVEIMIEHNLSFVII